MIEEKMLPTPVFTLDGRLENLGAGNISIQVLLHDPVEFAEVNRKGIFVGIGKEVKREKVANGNFCCFFFRCQLRCPPQWRIQQTMWSLWVPREGNVCLSLRLPALCTRCITVLQNCPLLTFFWQAIFFSKYTKSSCQLENSLKNLLDKFKYGGNYCLPLFHWYNFKMSALLLTKSTWLCDQEVCPRVQERRPNCLQVTPGLLQINKKCPLSSDQLYNMKSAYEKNR